MLRVKRIPLHQLLGRGKCSAQMDGNKNGVGWDFGARLVFVEDKTRGEPNRNRLADRSPRWANDTKRDAHCEIEGGLGGQLHNR